LVLRTFRGPPPPYYTPKHLNGDDDDCRLVNLVWERKRPRTAAEKAADSAKQAERRKPPKTALLHWSAVNRAGTAIQPRMEFFDNEQIAREVAARCARPSCTGQHTIVNDDGVHTIGERVGGMPQKGIRDD
jgi:hypothetical protein